MQLLHRRLQQLLRRRLNATKITDLRGPHLRITRHLGSLKPLQLPLSGSLHSLPDGFRVLDLPFVGEFFVIDAGDFDVDVDAVEAAAAYVFLWASDVVATGTGLRLACKWSYLWMLSTHLL